jgi:GT2 family glycosyltransferase
MTDPPATEQEPSAKVCAGIVNYNCGAETARCLRALLAQTLSLSRIVVVDNASQDGSGLDLSEEFSNDPSIQFILNEGNAGFAAAQNQAIRATNGEFYLALNPDTIPRLDYIQNLVAALRANPRAGYATGLIYFCDASGNPTPFIFSAGHWWLRGRTAINRYYKLTWPDEMIQSGEVGGASGCAPLYRREMLDAIDLGGGEFFDETYFMYIEDVDLDWRARLAGWTCWFEKSAVCLHEGEVTGGIKNAAIYGQLVGNRWLMVLKNDTLGSFLRHLPYIVKADLQHFWPELLKRKGGIPAFFHGLGKRSAQAWRKRKAVRKSARVSPEAIRKWMNDSLTEIHAFNDYRRANPNRIRPYPGHKPK